MALQKDCLAPTCTGHEEEGEAQKLSPSDCVRPLGSISQPATRNKLTYD